MQGVAYRFGVVLSVLISIVAVLLFVGGGAFCLFSFDGRAEVAIGAVVLAITSVALLLISATIRFIFCDEFDVWTPWGYLRD